MNEPRSTRFTYRGLEISVRVTNFMHVTRSLKHLDYDQLRFAHLESWA